jgi:hypothetical protein
MSIFSHCRCSDRCTLYTWSQQNWIVFVHSELFQWQSNVVASVVPFHFFLSHFCIILLQCWNYSCPKYVRNICHLFMRQKEMEWDNWGNYIWLSLKEFWMNKHNLPFVTATMHLLFFSKHTRGGGGNFCLIRLFIEQ